MILIDSLLEGADVSYCVINERGGGARAAHEAEVPFTWRHGWRLAIARAGAGDDLVREWPAPDFGAEKHMSYMLQWFAFAATTVGLWAYFTWRRRK